MSSKPYLPPPYGSLRSSGSNISNYSPTISHSSISGVHINGAFDGVESSGEGSCELHEYDSIRTASTGPRKKTNFIYEQAVPSPMSSPAIPARSRQITESVSDRSSRDSSSSADPLPNKEGTYLSKYMLFVVLVILAVSVAALVLVILTITGTIGPKCKCSEGEDVIQSPRTAESGISVQSLLRRIQALERKIEARNSAVDVFVKKHEDQVQFLQKQVSQQGRLINETASKVPFVDGSAEKKLNTEIRLLNKSVNALTNKDNELTSTVTELRQASKRISDKLTGNVTQLQSRILEVTQSSRNISTRAESLERGYARMSTEMKTLQGVDAAQNASHEALLSVYMRLRDSMAAVNTTLNHLSSKTGANFSSCEHRMIKGTPVSPGTGADASVSYIEPPDKRVVGITCSTDFAHEYKLKSTQKGLYECTCRGVAKSAAAMQPTTIHCYLHLWECNINT